jgi:hypothetical protein
LIIPNTGPIACQHGSGRKISNATKACLSRSRTSPERLKFGCAPRIAASSGPESRLGESSSVGTNKKLLHDRLVIPKSAAYILGALSPEFKF